MGKPGKLSFKLVEGWEQLPAGFVHKDVVGVAVDASDRVYVLARYDPRVLVYEPDGRFVMSFGEGMFTGRTHGLTIGPDGSVYCVDDRDHTVRKFSPDGNLLMTIGTVGVASDTGYTGTIASIQRGGPPFNRPTHLAVAPNGDLYITDGYGNARVHRFSAEGKLIQSWGEPGIGPGQFHLPHSVKIAPDGRVVVCDRENDRIQFFSPEGEYLSEWSHLQRPTDIYFGPDGLAYVSELAWHVGQHSFVHGEITEFKHGRVAVLDPATGEVLHRWGGPDITTPGNFCAPHCLAVDSRGDVYVGEVTWTDFVSKGKVPEGTHMFQKFARQ